MTKATRSVDFSRRIARASDSRGDEWMHAWVDGLLHGHGLITSNALHGPPAETI
jgi:hypothetical protein